MLHQGGWYGLARNCRRRTSLGKLSLARDGWERRELKFENAAQLFQGWQRYQGKFDENPFTYAKMY